MATETGATIATTTAVLLLYAGRGVSSHASSYLTDTYLDLIYHYPGPQSESLPGKLCRSRVRTERFCNYNYISITIGGKALLSILISILIVAVREQPPGQQRTNQAMPSRAAIETTTAAMIHDTYNRIVEMYTDSPSRWIALSAPCGLQARWFSKKMFGVVADAFQVLAC